MQVGGGNNGKAATRRAADAPALRRGRSRGAQHKIMNTAGSDAGGRGAGADKRPRAGPGECTQ